MKNKSELTLIILVLGIIFAISAISNNNLSDDQENIDGSVEIQDETNLKSPKISAIFPETFIHIDGSIPNNWSLTESTKDWCSGDGSWDNPYIIENVTINAGGTGNGIFINNSKNEYFIIKNCNVTNAGNNFLDAGIKMENTNNGTLTNNRCFDNGYNGILLYTDCNNNTISENVASNIGTNAQNYGIFLWINCNNNTISGNTANKNINNGISLDTICINNTISGNTANINTNYGIHLGFECNNNTISGNTVNDNLKGINIYNYCYNNTISGNTANNNSQYGIYFNDNCDDNIITGNMVNDNDDDGIVLDTNNDNNKISKNYVYFNKNEQIDISPVTNLNNTLSGNVLVSADKKFYNDEGIDTIVGYNLYLISAPILCVDIINQSFSTTEFLITINISSGFNIFSNFDFDFTIESIQMWWNGEEVLTNNIEELENCLYKVTLTPFFVQPGEDPILFNMTISATRHGDKYFELDFAVDPKAVESPPPSVGDDDDDDDDDNFLLVVGIASAISAIGAVAVISAILINKRLKLKRQT